MTKFEQDKIGREEIVNRICLLVDNLQKDQHFCLALDGDWGSGKSFVLDMVEEKLKQHREYVIIKYDAWANSFYSDPLIAILSCLIDGIEDKLYLVEQYAEKAKKAGKATLNALSKLSSKVNIFKSAIEGIKGIYKILHNPISMAELEGFKSYQDLLRETKQVLNDVTTTREYRGKQTKLIILVDEIDRCLPDEQLKVLERLHHLFDVKNCAVICALNKTSIEKTFKKIYDGEGNEYLRKFFDYNFSIKAESIKLLQYYLTVELFQKIRKVCKVESITGTTDLEIIDNNIMDTSFVVLKNIIEKRPVKVDNRQVQNYYSALLKVFDEFGWENLNSYYIYFIVLGLFVKKIFVGSFLEFDKYSKTTQQKLYARDYLGCVCNFNKYIESYEYARDFREYNRTFDYICDQLTRNSQFSYNINNKPFKGDTWKLKQLMLIYGGQNETNER